MHCFPGGAARPAEQVALQLLARTCVPSLEALQLGKDVKALTEGSIRREQSAARPLRMPVIRE